VAIGFINICANVAGVLGPPTLGQMKTMGFADATCLLVAAGCYAAGGAIVATLRVDPKAGARR